MNQVSAAASFELDLIEAYEEVVRVLNNGSRPGSSRRDIADRVSEYSESLLAVLDRLGGSTQPEWKSFRALALQLLAVARRFGEVSIRIEEDHKGKTPWGTKLPSTAVDVAAVGTPMPFLVTTVGRAVSNMISQQERSSATGLGGFRGPPPTILQVDEVLEYVDAIIFASCEIYCNGVKRYASLCQERVAQNRSKMEALMHCRTPELSQTGLHSDELFVLHVAFENDDTFARFWARRFGVMNLSVPSNDLVDALDSETYAGPENVRRTVVETAVTRCFDVHGDHYVDVGAVAAIAQAVNKQIFPSVLEMLQTSAKGSGGGGDPSSPNNINSSINNDGYCDRCSRLEAELALERKKNSELRAELGTRPKSHYLLSQLDAAHRTIASLQQQLGLSNRSEPMSPHDAAAESNRLRRAVLGVGLQSSYS